MLHFFQDIGRHMRDRGLKFASLSVWLLLFVGGLIGHPGSLVPYVAFTVVLTAVLIGGLYRPVSYGYLFLSIFFWLGFWLKLVIHNIFQYDYVEPIGRFDGSVAAWDEALWVPTVAGLGMLLGRLLYGLWRRKDDLQFSPDSVKVPAWYPVHRQIIWVALLGGVISLAALNSFYGIQQSGLTPRTILIWPLNGLIYWMLSTGLSMALATILWWDICLKRDISWSIYGLFAEAFFSTMSLLSRGLFVFHLVPPLLAIGLNRQKLVWRTQRKFVFAVAILGLFFVVSLAVVSTLRSYLFQSEQDFRTATQNKITRLQILRTVIPTLEERIVIKAIPRLQHLQLELPILEERIAIKRVVRLEEIVEQIKLIEELRGAVNLHDEDVKKRLLKNKLDPEIPLQYQFRVLIGEKAHLKQGLEPIREIATQARKRHKPGLATTEEEILFEDPYQHMAIYKAWLERNLEKLKENAEIARENRDLNQDSTDVELAFADQFHALTAEKSKLEKELASREITVQSALLSGSGRARMLLEELSYQLTIGLTQRVVSLGIDRWIGLEGVMAISAYSEKGGSLFNAALTERSGLTEVSLYQKVCQSIYQTSDMSKYQFASLPGAAAFFYYTGALWAVFSGMIFLTLLAISIEHLVHCLTKNVLLCALVGMNAANGVAQFGVVPRQLLIHFGMILLAVGMVWIVQSKIIIRLCCRQRTGATVVMTKPLPDETP